MQTPKATAAYNPTKTEFDVLQVLWQYGPSTVRFVHDKLILQKGEVAYTSTLKLMQLMHEKGILDRDESKMRHLYTSVPHESELTQTVLKRFIDSTFKGSPSSLMVALLGNSDTSAEELDKIRELIKNMKQ
ncbi:BlaI/MecI/CopY family transcriptional regulator [Pedobacter frigidisoli]|uniref:BlaI/MecI/CopY family transcriptional regulator n=1 Tax=Pedobacter frigidisoli TaxID=2530455 RepID=UPI00292D14A3|nr:BlaI/MecI/CopY family transcriptional regulator [Pedobacter frigidisoli]